MFLVYPLFQAQCDRCCQQNYTIKGHHLYSGKWNRKILMATIYSQQYMKTITMADIHSVLAWYRQTCLWVKQLNIANNCQVDWFNVLCWSPFYFQSIYTMSKEQLNGLVFVLHIITDLYILLYIYSWHFIMWSTNN